MCEKILRKVKYLRKQKNMTLNEIAEKTKLSVGYLSNIENCKRTPSLDTLDKIACALEIDIVDFF